MSSWPQVIWVGKWFSYRHGSRICGKGGGHREREALLGSASSLIRGEKGGVHRERRRREALLGGSGKLN